MQQQFRHLASPSRLTLAVALYFAAVLNAPFWRTMTATVAPDGPYEWLFILSVFVCVVCAYNIVLSFVANRHLFKVVVIPLLMAGAGASYFQGEYGVLIDRHMVQNILETNASEASDLMSWKLILYLVVLGSIPSWLIWRFTWPERSTFNDIRARTLSAALSGIIALAASAPFFMDFSSVFRENDDLKHKLIPFNIADATFKYVTKQKHAIVLHLKPFGVDAHMAQAASTSSRRRVTIILLGETVRADHFSLNGYERETTPELASIKGLINFPDAHSCGTDTAQSVPCIFSGVGRKNFSSDIALKQEGLLDVLKHAGLEVLWRENQSGCKGTCARVPTDLLTGMTLAPYYENGESHDEILLDGLDQRLRSFTRDGVVVLHMMGSHGPAYYKRYPASYEHFKPACHDSQFSKCTQEEIINAYDNTIRYTDHVIARLIALLAKLDDEGIDSSLLFASDHGESLGEHNVYLHGMPYALAPEEQKHVPMVVWLSEGMRRNGRIDQTCLERNRSNPVSHDNIFHSVLGLSGVMTRVYDRSLDLFAKCRSSIETRSEPSPASHL